MGQAGTYFCEAISEHSWPVPGMRCSAQQRVRISGKGYCRRHGAKITLEVAIKTGLALELDPETYQPKKICRHCGKKR